MNRRKISISGFSIIEVALVVLVGGILLTTAATTLIDYLQQLKVTTTQNRMQEVNNAIVMYLQQYSALPCAASLTDAQDSTTFGRQINDPPGGITNNNYSPSPPGGVPNNCYASVVPGVGAFQATSPSLPPPLLAYTPDPVDGTTPTPPPPYTSSGFVVIGAVPVRDLNLPDQDIADAWGDRFVYAVSDVLTIIISNTNGSSSSAYDSSQGSISVIDGTGAEITGRPGGAAQFVLLSLGADRAGAYTIAGAPPSAGSCPAPGTVPEAQNCNFPTAIFRKTTQTTGFDDIVTFYAQSNSTDTMPPGIVTSFPILSVCPPGWFAYSGDACTGQSCCQKF